MKFITNSFLGGFFRKLGNIVAFLLIICLIGFILSENDFRITDLISFPIMKVKADETSGYGSARYIDCSYGMDGMGRIDNDDNLCSNWINFGTEHTYDSIRYMYQNSVFITSGSYTWEKGRTYTINMTLAINPKDYDNFYTSFRISQRRFEGGTTTNTSSLSVDNLVDGSSYLFLDNVSDNTYWVTLRFVFVPNTNLKSVWFQLLYPNLTTGTIPNGYGLSLYDFQYYRINSVTYVDNNDFSSVNNSINNQTNVINNGFNELNDNLTSDDVDESIDEAENFFSNFTTNQHGLTGIITAPLNAIQSLTSKTCSPLVLPLPFVNQNLTLPCMRDIYEENFGAFMNIYDVITSGIISYWIMVRIFALVKDFKNPDHDEIEVMDL